MNKGYIPTTIAALALTVSIASLVFSHVYSPSQLSIEAYRSDYFRHFTDNVEIALQDQELSQQESTELQHVKERQKFLQHRIGISLTFINSGNSQILVKYVGLAIIHKQFSHLGCEKAADKMEKLDAMLPPATDGVVMSVDNTVNSLRFWDKEPLLLAPKHISIPTKMYFSINRPQEEKEKWNSCLYFGIIDAKGREYQEWREIGGSSNEDLSKLSNRILINKWF